MEKSKIIAVVDSVLFGLPVGDGEISILNNAYHIQNKREKATGLIEELQIKTGSNLGVNAIVAKKLRDGIVDGFVKYLEQEAKIAENKKVVAKEEKETKKESEEFEKVAESIVDDLAQEEPKKPKADKKKTAKK